VLETLTTQLAAGKNLAAEQVFHAVAGLTDENIPAPAKADFLTALAQKGETPEEIAAFAAALREKSVPPPIDAAWRESREILDLVGTGGDRHGTFNISTTSALVCAAAGVAVAKHGNRAVTSQAGSADVLEALGIRIDLSPAEAAQALREKNFAFFFAPNFHPAFRHIAAARKLCAARGQRTIFNFLGPLLNPARPSAMLVGVPRAELCEPLAKVLQSLGVRRAMVVTGKIGNRKFPGRAFAARRKRRGGILSRARFYDFGFDAGKFPVAARDAGRPARWRQVSKRGNHPENFARHRTRPEARRGFAQCRRGVVRGGKDKVACGRLGTGGRND
jgi:anthranilate phosphoribosyltransferase